VWTMADFLLPNPKLLAKLASVLVAVAFITSFDAGGVERFGADVRGCSEGVLLRPLIPLLMASEASADEGDGGEPNGLPSAEGVEGATVGCSSDSAVVGAALPAANAGNRTPENLEAVDNRDARDPGRSGDGAKVC